VFASIGVCVDYVFVFDNMTEQDMKDRLSGRLVHSNSGRIYHKKFNPPKEEGKDDVCEAIILPIALIINPTSFLKVTKENLEVRHDDKEEAFDIRIAAYNSQAEGIREHYKKTGVLYNIDATKSMDEVYAHIKEIIENPENVQRAVQRREALAAAPPAPAKGMLLLFLIWT
jgi:adenylate kinase